VIKSFGDKRTAAIFVGLAVRDLPQRASGTIVTMVEIPR
jgi:hypothetical protein